MELEVDNQFKKICEGIREQNKSESEWAFIESDDMIQVGNYIGGFDATEMAFCFSYFDEKNNEYWFQISLAEVERISTGLIEKLTLRKRPE